MWARSRGKQHASICVRPLSRSPSVRSNDLEWALSCRCRSLLAEPRKLKALAEMLGGKVDAFKGRVSG